MARLTSQPGGDELPFDLPLTGIVPVSQMIGEDEEETERLLQMESRARAFLSRFEWCASIRELYFGAGIGGIFAVFLAHITPSRPGIDEYLWVVVGDLPSAYLVMDAPPTPRDALSRLHRGDAEMGGSRKDRPGIPRCYSR